RAPHHSTCEWRVAVSIRRAPCSLRTESRCVRDAAGRRARSARIDRDIEDLRGTGGRSDARPDHGPPGAVLRPGQRAIPRPSYVPVRQTRDDPNQVTAELPDLRLGGCLPDQLGSVRQTIVSIPPSITSAAAGNGLAGEQMRPSAGKKNSRVYMPWIGT